MTNENGVYTIPCKVNGIDMNFIFDTGASNVCISLSEALFMIKNGYISQRDILGSSYAQIANGEFIENTSILIRQFQIGELKLTNVKATIVHELSAPLLLGQTAIQQLGRIIIHDDELIILDKNNSHATKASEDQSIALFKQAYEAHENKNYTQAIKLYEQYLALNPNDAAAYNNLGTIYNHLKNYNKSLEYYQKALSNDPNHELTKFNIGHVYQYGLKNIDEAIKWYRASKDEKAYISLGDIYYSQKKFKEASSCYTSALSINSDNFHVQRQNGYAYMGFHEYYQAINSFNRAMRLDTTDYNIYKYRGISKYYVKQFKGALSDIGKYLIHAPSDSTVFDMYGRLLLINKQNEKALEYFNKSPIPFFTTEQLIAFYYDRGYCNYSLAHYQAAIDDFSEGLKSSLDSVTRIMFYTKLANTYHAMDDYPNAISNIEKAILINPDSLDLYYTKASIYYSKTDYQTAIQTYSYILSCDSYAFFAYFMRGRAKDALGNLNEAIQDYDFIIQHKGKNINPHILASSYNNKAFALCKQKQYKQGLINVLYALDINDTLSYIWDTKGEILYHLGRYKECIETMNKALSIKTGETAHDNSFYFRGLSKIKIGDIDGAKIDLMRSAQLGKNEASIKLKDLERRQ